MSTSDLHSRWARLFVSSLASAGVHRFVVSPGSRSTPLALAVAAEARLRTQVILDERAAAFFALGQARVTREPTALLCTSGTAGAHYLPAIIEASQSHVPLLLITADRPWEAYDAAAAQTIDQVKLFGDYVRHYAELGLPDPSPNALRAVVRIAAQAVSVASAPIPGPVHINARFRKPLEPIPGAGREPWSAQLDELLARGAARSFPPITSADPRAISALAEHCKKATRGLIVCGPAWAGSDAATLRAGVQALSQATGFPIWAEATSGARFGGGAAVIAGFDAMLRVPEFRQRHAPDLVIELGGPPVSGAYATYLMEHASCARAVIAAHGWNDPIGSATLMIWGDPGAAAQQVAGQLTPSASATDWRAAIAAAEQVVVEAVAAEREPSLLTEGEVARLLVDALPADALLMVGNSLPVRDLDTFCPAGAKPLRVLHQRGASGIDGLIAGAAGSRSVSDKPLALLLGDLSALHDVGGLGTLAAVSGPLAVVIVQNRGGRIFEQLPIAQNESVRPAFEQLFLTPQNADFAHAAQLFGLAYTRAENRAEFERAVSVALQSPRPLIIEAMVPPDDGKARRARIFARVATALGGSGAAVKRPSALSQSSALPGVYLHGFLGAPIMWEPLAAQQGGPSSLGYLPGHGPAPWTLPGADFDAVVDAMAAALPFERCEIHGYSMGARLALALALRHPERVAALTLIGVDPGLRCASDHPDRTARIAWEDELAARLESSSLAAFVEHWESLPLFATQRELAPSLLARQRTLRLRHVPAALAWALRTLGTGRMPNLWPQLASLHLPIRVITGELDTKFTEIGAEMAKLAPNLQHLRIANAGHNVVLEAPDAVLRLLQNTTQTRART